MANGPEGDIELLLSSPNRFLYQKGANLENDEDTAHPKIRLRFSRQTQAIDISRCISGSQGQEWINRVIHTGQGRRGTKLLSDWEKLEGEERDSLNELARFVLLCEAYERLECQSTPITTKLTADELSSVLLRPPDGKSLESRRPTDSQTITQRADSSSMVTKAFSPVSLPPRPMKFSASYSTPASNYFKPGIPTTPFTRSSLSKDSLEVCRNDSGAAINMPSNFQDLFPASDHAVQSRFIPAVGWCMRYNSRVSQGGRYKILLLDGTALDVDVDEEWVEYTNKLGRGTRCVFASRPTRLVDLADSDTPSVNIIQSAMLSNG